MATLRKTRRKTRKIKHKKYKGTRKHKSRARKSRARKNRARKGGMRFGRPKVNPAPPAGTVDPPPPPPPPPARRASSHQRSGYLFSQERARNKLRSIRDQQDTREELSRLRGSDEKTVEHNPLNVPPTTTMQPSTDLKRPNPMFYGDDGPGPPRYPPSLPGAPVSKTSVPLPTSGRAGVWSL